MAKIFLHQDKDFNELVALTASELGINPYLVEKDYWIMHCLYGLQVQGFDFELKGGTSLSKAFHIIDRFSEDIDLKILPPKNQKVMMGKNHMKDAHIESRKNYFDWLSENIEIHGVKASREYLFDDEKFRNAGINLTFKSYFEQIEGVKPVVLLETGFDDTTPNVKKDISSWVFERAQKVETFNYIDNRAKEVRCYIPEFTFIEKLQAISTKYRKFKESGKIDKNFMRHYYDVYCLLGLESVQSFIGTEGYVKRKLERFPLRDEPEKLHENGAFKIQSPKDFEILNSNYTATKNLYYKGQPSLELIFERIEESSSRF